MIYIGTSGWAYASWKPEFYPAKTPAAKFLSFYASQLNSVEVNFTFRSWAKESLLTKWAASTPDGFLFAMKAHQRITHIKRLKDVQEDTREFCASLEPLARARRLGPVLFQLPPNLKADASLLTAFLAGIPRGARIAFEFRHPSWFEQSIFRLLREHNAALCVAESDDLQTRMSARPTSGISAFANPNTRPSS